jgi:type IV pilus assembly protein PilV
MNTHSMQRARGFSLVEVMVAVIVICVGLLGVAKMQALSLSSTNNSRMRALASIEAASLASAMHSNRQYWSNSIPVNFSVTYANGALTSTDANLTAALAASNTTACINVQCTAVALAAFDLTRWSASVAGLLPNATTTVSCPPPPVGTVAPTSCTIFITWTERTVALSSTAAAAGQFQNPNYTLLVEP